ncbi:MAG: HAD-IIB family hydrolase [Acidobacteria bacterium]|nr:HAD-IIB family hydrolase [Acidobacteriota bacterium]
MRSSGKLIIYTDLDGTFLDHETYSCSAALPALRAATARAIPVVFCSSKTLAETEVIRKQVGARDPFIVENGGAVYVPRNYFPFGIRRSVQRGDFEVVELGTPYPRLVEALRRLREDLPCRFLGFHDMTEEEVAADAGLTLAEAQRAKEREYDEAFKIVGADPAVVGVVLARIEEAGLRYTRGGRYYHLLGDHDKGRAVRILNDLFRRAHGSIVTVGLGDTLNDLPMLEAVDLPVVVKKADGDHDRSVIGRLPQVRLAPGVGPRGWEAAVREILAERVGA